MAPRRPGGAQERARKPRACCSSGRSVSASALTASSRRPPWRQHAITVSSRSANRPPASALKARTSCALLHRSHRGSAENLAPEGLIGSQKRRQVMMVQQPVAHYLGACFRPSPPVIAPLLLLLGNARSSSQRLKQAQIQDAMCNIGSAGSSASQEPTVRMPTAIRDPP
jgi:hypothetical protein